jgi:intracellular septation protein A
MPPNYWLYVWGILAIFFAFSHVAYSPEEVASAIILSMIVAAVFTLWLAVIHKLCYASQLIHKIVAIIVGGVSIFLFWNRYNAPNATLAIIFAVTASVIIVSIIQFLYHHTLNKGTIKEV